MSAGLVPGLLLGLALLLWLLPGGAMLVLERTGLPPAGPPAPRLPMSDGRLRVLVLVAGSLLLAVLAGPWVALLAAGASTVAPGVLRARRAGADEVRERARSGEAYAVLAAELRVGRSLPQALDAAAGVACGGTAAVLAEAAVTARSGGDVPVVLRRSGPGAGAGLLADLATCWQVCARSGTGLAAAVERLAAAGRAREEQERAVQAALAGPRSTAGLLAVLPLAGIGLAAVLGADPLHVLLGTPLGALCLLAGLALDGLGWWWTRRLAARAGR